MSSLQNPSLALHTLDQALATDDASDHDEEKWLGYEGMHPMTWLPAPRVELTGAARQ